MSDSNGNEGGGVGLCAKCGGPMEITEKWVGLGMRFKGVRCTECAK